MKICVVTGSRAEFGLLHPVMQEIVKKKNLGLQIIATGMHLSPEFGLTYRDIEQQGFTIDAKVDMLLSSDSDVGTAKSIGLGVIGFADALKTLNPDVLMLLGDRFELLAAAQAALILRIPIAHISGGDTTEGAFDEAIRHSITKMSHLHFVTNADAAARVRQLGEDPDRVYLVGNPGLCHLRDMTLLEREDFENSIGFALRPKNILVTYHPATLDDDPDLCEARAMLHAIEELGPDVGVIITRPNADTAGRALMKLVGEYSAGRDNVSIHTSLGQKRYLSALKHVDAVVGNSSSGLLEAPSFNCPTVNIGDRQKGRMRATSVMDVADDEHAIRDAIESAFGRDRTPVENPYDHGDAAKKIADVLEDLTDPGTLIKKSFFDHP